MRIVLLTFHEFYNLWKNRDKPAAQYLLKQVDVSQVRLFEKFAMAKEFEVQKDENIDT